MQILLVSIAIGTSVFIVAFLYSLIIDGRCSRAAMNRYIGYKPEPPNYKKLVDYSFKVKNGKASRVLV